MGAEQITIAVGYVRVATGSQRQREGAVYLQRQAILRYAQIHGIRIARFFSDHACVGDIAERQGLSDAMAFIAKGKATALIVADLMRLTRAVEQLLRFVDAHKFLKDGPALISVQERLDTRTAEGHLLLETVHTLAAWESSTLAEGV